MDVKITLDLEELKRRLCPACQAAMEKYLKELAAAQLLKDTDQDNG